MRPKSHTCIAVVREKSGKLIFASDRRMSWDDMQQAMPGPKTFKRNGIILAGAGDGYFCSLIAKHMPLPTRQIDEDEETYMFDAVYEQVRRVLFSKGFTTDDKTLALPVETDFEVLMAINHRLFSFSITNSKEETSVNGTIAIDELNVPCAIGCGGPMAWGSLLTTEGSKLSAEKRLRIALKVAAKISPGCDDNIDITRED